MVQTIGTKGTREIDKGEEEAGVGGCWAGQPLGNQQAGRIVLAR